MVQLYEVERRYWSGEDANAELPGAVLHAGGTGGGTTDELLSARSGLTGWVQSAAPVRVSRVGAKRVQLKPPVFGARHRLASSIVLGDRVCICDIRPAAHAYPVSLESSLRAKRGNLIGAENATTAGKSPRRYASPDDKPGALEPVADIDTRSRCALTSLCPTGSSAAGLSGAQPGSTSTVMVNWVSASAATTAYARRVIVRASLS